MNHCKDCGQEKILNSADRCLECAIDHFLATCDKVNEQLRQVGEQLRGAK